MGSFKRLLRCLIAACMGFSGLAMGSLSQQTSGQIISLLYQKQVEEAIGAYQKAYNDSGAHDFTVLQQMALTIMQQGIESRDDESALLAVFGAGIAAHDETLPILCRGMDSFNPQLQIAALSFLVHLHQKEADEALFRGMRSSYLPIRFQAALYLAQRKDPRAVPAIESLMAKSPKELQPLFPVLFGLVGSEKGLSELKKCMYKVDPEVRVAALLSAVEHHRDDLSDTVRTLLCQCNIPDAEASAFALGALGDRQAAGSIRLLLKSSAPEVRIAAILALRKLGFCEEFGKLEALAKEGDLFAIYALREFPDAAPILLQLLKENQGQVQVNAAMALLHMKNSQGVKILLPFLVKDSRDLGLKKMLSPGKTLISWKAVPSSRENFKKDEAAKGMALSIRENILQEAIDLPERDFLALAGAVLSANERELVPKTVSLLINLSTEGARGLLRKNESKLGAPLVRAYCNLGLVRMKESGPYFEHLQKWVEEQKQYALIRFRPQFVWGTPNIDSDLYQLTPEETSRLLIESLETLAKQQSEAGINALLSVLKDGNPKNRYALAGLLMRSTI